MTLFLQLPNEPNLIEIQCTDDSVLNSLSSSTTPVNFITKNNQDIIINHYFWTAIPNVIRYKFKYSNSKFCSLTMSKKIHPNSNYNEEFLYFNNHNHRKIVIVLESPHVDEYTSDMQPISPAQADTGTKINSNIESLLKNINSHVQFKQNEVIEIALVNPIPLQTSLGTIHGENLADQYLNLRNNVWKGIWRNTDYRKKFIDQINTLYSRDIIINACTDKLKNEVTKSLSEAKDFEGSIFNTYHPGARGNWLNGFKKIRLPSIHT
ncbi:hypothetical protein ACFSY7_07950 [Kurthia populi]|uniref:Uncharacterized protein n=2 Tax=Kurthia populi TaxID=1562132 RepID=A0ABW5Y071_9BACL